MSAFTPRTTDAMHPMAAKPPVQLTERLKAAKVAWLANHAARLDSAKFAAGIGSLRTLGAAR